jgi:hypothetical protein
VIQFGYLDSWQVDAAGTWRAVVLLDEEPLEDVTLLFPASLEPQLARGMRVLVSFIGESNSDVIAMVVGTRNSSADAIQLRVGDTVVTVEETRVTVSAAAILLGSDAATERVAFQSALEQLADVLGTWVVAPTDGGGALKTLLTALMQTGWPVGATKTKAE